MLIRRYQNEFGPIIVTVLPDSLLKEVLKSVHDNHGHQGWIRTFHIIRSRFFIPNLARRVKKYIRSCPNCQKIKTSYDQKLGSPSILPTTASPYQICMIDFKGLLPTSSTGNKHIIVLVDVTTRWIEAKATRNQNSDTLARFLYEDIICIICIRHISITINATIRNAC